jgi:hypothetical protein
MALLDWITGNSQRPTYSWIKAKLKCLLMAVQGLVTFTFADILAETSLPPRWTLPTLQPMDKMCVTSSQSQFNECIDLIRSFL